MKQQDLGLNMNNRRTRKAVLLGEIDQVNPEEHGLLALTMPVHCAPKQNSNLLRWRQCGASILFSNGLAYAI
jgi:hypothetical protein